MTPTDPSATTLRPAPLHIGVLLGVLGVVYGDIGTSPLYAFKATLEHFKHDGIDSKDVLGILSMIFWSLILVVTVKYVLIIMRADNRGEGGILALMALAQRGVQNLRLRAGLTLVGIAGACLFFGDGVITPAISVLSAVEGLQIVDPRLHKAVIPISLVVILGLFLIQWRGTGVMGKLFGPITLVWFLVLGVLGVVEIVANPSVLLALSPTYAFYAITHHQWLSLVALGSVVLAVTGAEALYADMGHFGARPIQMAWLYFVLPCLVLNYFGQGALVLAHPEAMQNPFFLLAPEWFRLPLVLLATAATVIASQAMISGAYSVARQCMQLGFLPRLTVRHTSSSEEGQIYLPQVNWALMVGVVILVLVFQTSDNLAAAYGIAVTGTFLCTSVLAAVVFRRHFGWRRSTVLSVFGAFFVLDLIYFGANVLKVPQGGWVPLVLGLALMAMMTSWKRGRDLLLDRWKQDSLPLSSFLARLPQSRTIRVPGMAIFMTGNSDYVPGALLHNLKHNKVLHERVLFVTVANEDMPSVPAAERATVTKMSDGIHRVIIRYGFMESPHLPRDLAAISDAEGLDFDPLQASYFLGRETLVAAARPKMPIWRLWLFLVMARNAISATEFFRIPTDRVVELGVRVAI
ncbi:MAG: potassium transporter Kup [Alphaproteobacteria bacterium]|nr:potassium transporter Kup [Alphaproteobacteria bacterium]